MITLWCNIITLWSQKNLVGFIIRKTISYLIYESKKDNLLCCFEMSTESEEVEKVVVSDEISDNKMAAENAKKFVNCNLIHV